MKSLLEGLVRDYQTTRNYFCRLNVKYKLINEEGEEHGSPYDIDVLAVNMNTSGVIVCDCKSWAEGFDSNYFIRCLEKKIQRKYNCFKALSYSKVEEALEHKVYELTGKKEFRYIIYCLMIESEDRYTIEDYLHKNNITIGSNKIEIVDLKKIYEDVRKHLRETYIERGNSAEPETEFEQLVRYLEAIK